MALACPKRIMKDGKAERAVNAEGDKLKRYSWRKKAIALILSEVEYSSAVLLTYWKVNPRDSHHWNKLIELTSLYEKLTESYFGDFLATLAAHYDV